MLGRIAKEIGWGQSEVVASLEKKREAKAAAYFAEKIKLEKKAKAVAAATPGAAVLAKFGY